MIEPSYVDIIAYVALVVLAIVSAICNPFFRRIRKKDGDGGEVDVSVVVLDNGDSAALERCLRSVLDQEYAARFEVILVTEQKDSVAERIMQQIGDERLTATYVPHHPLFMSRNKLAVSLGVKAAKNGWIVLLKGNVVPQSTAWLSGMMQQAGHDTDLIIAPENFDETTSAYKRYLRLRRSMYALRKASWGRAFCCCGSNIAFRRDMFIDGDGYRGNLQHTAGEYDFIINKYAAKKNAAVAVSGDCITAETKPTRHEWRQSEKQRVHVRKHLKHGFCHRMLCLADMLLLYLSIISAVGAIIYASFRADYVLLSAGIASLIVNAVPRIILFQRAKHRYGFISDNAMSALLEPVVPFHNAICLLRYALTNAKEFSTHKL